jgi:hypothetical protein
VAQNAVTMGMPQSRRSDPIVGRTNARRPSVIKQPKLKCFVAMAFEQPDTERWFDGMLKPLLKAVNAEARRVDRIEHNDDIDDRILAEIAAAHFVVADLTYARPSVYFEAGYAQRAIPVIYTCRGDHLGAPTTSSNRVHFDLQMKNIVPWRLPLDERFRKRMEARLRLVTAPLARLNMEEIEAAAQAARFGSFSRSHQLDLASAAIEAAAKKARLKELRESKAFRGALRMISSPVLPVMTGSHKGWIRLLTHWVVPSLNQKLLEGVKAEVSLGRYNFEVRGTGREVRGVTELVVLVSLNSVPLERIRSAFPSWRVTGSNPKQVELHGMETIRRQQKALKGPRQVQPGRSEPSLMPWRSRLVVIDAVQSEELLIHRLKQVMNGFDELENATWVPLT